MKKAKWFLFGGLVIALWIGAIGGGFLWLKEKTKRSQVMSAWSRGRTMLMDDILSEDFHRGGKGLPSLWQEANKYSNSTEFFEALAKDEVIKRHSVGGGGLPRNYGADRLSSENNMWTVVVKTDDDDTPGWMPILISRNIDPLSLIPGEGSFHEQKLRLSSEFSTPWGSQAGVIIFRDGTASTFGVGLFSETKTEGRSTMTRIIARNGFPFSQQTLWLIYIRAFSFHREQKTQEQEIREAFKNVKFLTPTQTVSQ